MTARRGSSIAGRHGGAAGVAVALLLASMAARAQQGAQYSIGLAGLNCPASCTADTLQRLRQLPGVADVDVNPNTKRALVTMAGGAQLDRAAAKAALRGSSVSVVTFDAVAHAARTP